MYQTDSITSIKICFYCGYQDSELDEIIIRGNEIKYQCYSRNLCRKRDMLNMQIIGCSKCHITNELMIRTGNRIIFCKPCFNLGCANCGIIFDETTLQIRTNSSRRICKICHELAVSKSIQKTNLNSNNSDYILLNNIYRFIQPILISKISIKIKNLVYNFFQ